MTEPLTTILILYGISRALLDVDRWYQNRRIEQRQRESLARLTEAIAEAPEADSAFMRDIYRQTLPPRRTHLQATIRRVK